MAKPQERRWRFTRTQIQCMRKGHRFSGSGTKIVRCCNCCWEVPLSCHSPNASTSSRWFCNFFTGTCHECLIAIAGVPLNEQHKLSCAWPAWHKNLLDGYTVAFCARRPGVLLGTPQSPGLGTRPLKMSRLFAQAWCWEFGWLLGTASWEFCK